MMKFIAKKIVFIIGLCCLQSFNQIKANIPSYMNHGVLDIKKSIKNAQKSFSNTYYDILIENEAFFKDAYSNNLIVSENIDWDFAKNGLVFMRLIEYLEKNESSDAQEILAKINDLFFLQFHQYLSHSDFPREKQVLATKALHCLFNFKDQHDKHPLRSTLTRMFIHTMMIEMMNLPYYEKREVILFAFEDFRAALQKAAKASPDNAEALENINTLVNDFAAYGIKEPVIKPKNFKKWITWIAIAGACITVIYLINRHIGTWDKLKNILDDLATSLITSCSKALDKNKDTLNGVAASVSTTLYQNFSKPTAEAFVEAIAYEPLTQEEIEESKKPGAKKIERRPNIAMTKLFENASNVAGKNFIDGITYEPLTDAEIEASKLPGAAPIERRPNQATAQLAKDFSDNFVDGMTYEPLTKEEIEASKLPGAAPIKRRQKASTSALIAAISRDAGQNFIDGITYEALTEAEIEASKLPGAAPIERRKNPTTAQLAKDFSDNFVDGMTYEPLTKEEIEASKLPGAEPIKRRKKASTADLAQDFGDNFIKGLTYEDGVEDLPENAIPPMPAGKRKNRATRTLIHNLGGDLIAGITYEEGEVIDGEDKLLPPPPAGMRERRTNRVLAQEMGDNLINGIGKGANKAQLGVPGFRLNAPGIQQRPAQQQPQARPAAPGAQQPVRDGEQREADNRAPNPAAQNPAPNINPPEENQAPQEEGWIGGGYNPMNWRLW